MIKELFEEKPQLKKIVLISLLIIVVIIIISIIMPLFKSKKMTYSELENKINEAAISYYETNSDKLPSEGSSVTLPYDALVTAEKLKKIDSYIKDETCSASVVVKNVDGKYSYTPYLDCGSNYKTQEFYNKIISDNPIVEQSSGLYLMNDSKIFRGENINNFVRINNNLWRIIKIDSDNTVKLIMYNNYEKNKYDDRFNSEKSSSVGKNIYSLSRLKETMDTLYSSNTLLDDNIKSKLVSKPLCIGSRTKDYNLNDGSVECSETLTGEYIGHLSLNEYITASLDSNCTSSLNNECQNYNYLSETQLNNSWWLLTPVSGTTHQMYYVTSIGSIGIVNCSSTLSIRPTIYLDTNVMYISGTGTKDNPYIIK